MSGSRKEKVTIQTPTLEEATEETSRDVFLREGRTLRVTDEGGEELVEIRSGSGQLELRIKLTEQGPVLQMESVRLQLKASEAVEIESKRVDIKATEGASLETGGELKITGEADVKVNAAGDVVINGKMIYLN